MIRPKNSRSLRIAAILATTSVAALSWAPAASAVGGTVDVTNTETIQVYTDASGAVQTKRVYEQLAFTGTGTVDVSNPIEADGLRNLDSFGGFDVEGGNQVARLTVDGEERLRSVSNFDGELPLDVNVQYFLDGKKVEPGDIVGAAGELEVLYSVENVTAAPQEITFDDGLGGTITKTVAVPVPMVGSLTTVAPSTFTDVASKQANMAGDGKGGTKLSFTMTLFPPLGSATAEFGYTATVTDGVVPRADITALPVNPLESPTFASAGASYKGGAESGIELAEGASTIDENLLKLRDGAGDLLAGLIQLRDGSDQLYVGLSDKAVPGATKLADGAGQLADGAGKASDGGKLLRDGAGTLSGGLGELSGGALELDNGAGQILEGQKALRDGLLLLESGVKVLPESVRKQLAANTEYQALLGGMQNVVNGIGNPNDVTNPATGQPATIFGGLNAVRYGLTNPQATQAACAAKDTSKCGATDALDFISYKLGVALAGPATVDGTVAKLKAAINGIASASDCGAVCQATVAGTAAAVETSQKESLTELRAGVDSVSGGIKSQITGSGAAIDKIKGGLNNPGANPNCAIGASTASPADDCGVQQAVAFFKTSIPVLVDSITANITQTLLAGVSVPAKGCDPNALTLLCGADALVAGSGDLKGGTSKLLAGSGELDAGGSLLYSKLGELAAGLGAIDDGSQKLADGSKELTDGLIGAADGSRQLSEGLGQAADGAPQLVDGAQRLSDEGTKQLVGAGEDTAQRFGELYATIEAGAERANTEKMAYGAPEGATGLTAYSYVIQGEDGEGERNVARGLTGLGLLGAGAGAFALRRRVI